MHLIPKMGLSRKPPPLSNKSWKGVFNATKIPAECPQRDVFERSTSITGEEDCLFLNVYTPKIDYFERDLLPVMVLLHGGGFLVGSGSPLSFGPDILLDKDVVLVTLNYRLGFISTGDDVVPGNNGLKDQSLALKWVNKNIHSFGGDNKKITLFGFSAGGSAVHYHMMSPLSKGLFSKAIFQSGNALTPWAFGENNETVRSTEKLAQSLNCPIRPSRDMINCLRKIDANTIIGQDKIFIKWDYDPIIPFRPTIEQDIEGAFLTDHPVNLMKSGKCMDIPVMTGFTKDDGSFKASGFKNLNLLNDFAQRFDEIAPISVIYGMTNNDTKTVTKAIRKFYFEDQRIENSIENIVKLYTDSWIMTATDQFLTLFRKYYSKPLYFYLLTYRGSLSLTQTFQAGDEDYGVCHGDDLLYLFQFGYYIRPDWVPTKTDRLMMQVHTTLFTNFALTGNPTPVINEIINTQWKTYTIENEEYLNLFPGKLKMENKVIQNRTEFWRKIMNN